MPPDKILTINGGSSSIKFALFAGTPPERTLTGKIDRIGLPNTQLFFNDLLQQSKGILQVPDGGFKVAGDFLIAWLADRVDFKTLQAIGHRVVHGGATLSQPQRVTDAVLAELRRISPYDPEHLPSEIALIELFQTHSPALPQIVCFDTAFHHTLPRVAQILPIPRRYEALGVRRYGFHGLSYQFLMAELERVAGPDAARGRIILAHLGNGASLAAVKNGACIDTSMAFTPTAGIVMGSRSGDLDPGLVNFLASAENMSAEQFHAMVNHASGLLGVSETSSDMRDLQAREATDIRAAEAVALFCYEAKKRIGAYAAALGGLDTLIFAGGIGEHGPDIRARICDGLNFLGIDLDAERNAANATVISKDGAPATVRVITTDEESVIAQNVLALISGASVL